MPNRTAVRTQRAKSSASSPRGSRGRHQAPTERWLRPATAHVACRHVCGGRKRRELPGGSHPFLRQLCVVTQTLCAGIHPTMARTHRHRASSSGGNPRRYIRRGRVQGVYTWPWGQGLRDGGRHRARSAQLIGVRRRGPGHETGSTPPSPPRPQWGRGGCLRGGCCTPHHAQSGSQISLHGAPGGVPGVCTISGMQRPAVRWSVAQEGRAPTTPTRRLATRWA